MSEPSPGAPVVLYDGACGFCDRTVAFVIRRDPTAVFRFAALQSDVGRALLERFGLPTDAFSTIVLIDGGRALTRSDAALEIARRLRAPWRWIAGLRRVPKPVRDRVYDLVARHRHRLWPPRDACPVPSDDVRRRFLA